MSIQGILTWFQPEALTALFIIAIIHTIWTFVWKRAYIVGVIGLVIIGFATFIVSNPQSLVTIGQWFSGLISWG